MATDIASGAAGASSIDMLFRFRSDSGVTSVAASPTAKAVEPFRILARDCVSLAEAVRSLHANLEYQAVFHSYQLDELTDEEFAQQAEEFAYEPRVLPLDELAKRVAAIVRWIPDWHLTTNDVATMFRVTDESVSAMMATIQDIDTFAANEGGAPWPTLLGDVSRVTSSS